MPERDAVIADYAYRLPAWPFVAAATVIAAYAISRRHCRASHAAAIRRRLRRFDYAAFRDEITLTPPHTSFRRSLTPSLLFRHAITADGIGVTTIGRRHY